MGDASLLHVPLAEDVLQKLLTISNSGSLKDALENLIATSRTAIGRSDLGSKNILPEVLKLTQSIKDSSGCQYLLLLLKLLRNLSAGEITNQNSFIEQNGVGIILRVLRSAVNNFNRDYGTIRMGLQVLANVSLAGEKQQRVIWSQFFPNEFVALAGVRCQETCDPLCMIIYTCIDGIPGLLKDLCADNGLPIIVEIVHTTSVGFKEDWFKLLVSRICLEEMHFPQLFSRLSLVDACGKCGDFTLSEDTFSYEQAFLLKIVSEIVNERIEEIIVSDDFTLSVLQIFRRSVGLVDFYTRGAPSLPTSSTAINVLGYSLSILRDIFAREDPAGSSSENRADLVSSLQSHGLIELFLSLLRDLEPPEIIRRAMRQSENQGETGSNSAKSCPYKGFRKDIVAVIGNCAYRRKHIQDEIREKSGILLLLQQCVTDDHNPFLREWGIWCVRNLLEGNTENQEVVARLELQGSIDVPELAELGLKVELDKQTRRAKLVNVPSKS